MKTFIPFCLLAFVLYGCFGTEKKDILSATISKEKQLADMDILKGIITNMHAGVYAYNTPAQINLLFDSIYHTIGQPLTTREFYNKIDCIVDRLKCIHTSTALPEAYYDTLKRKPFFFPIPLIDINNRLRINAEGFIIPLGAEILSINNNSAAEIINKLATYTHTDGNSTLMKNCAISEDFPFDYYMAYGPAQRFDVQYREYKNDTIKTEWFSASDLKSIFKTEYDDRYYFYADDAPYDFEIADKLGTAVLTVRTFSYETKATNDAFFHFIDNSFRLIKQNGIKNLVIDCRNNGGGQYRATYSLLSYLVNEKMMEFDSATKRYNKLTYTTYLDAEDTARIAYEDTTANKYTLLRRGVYSLKPSEINTWNPDPDFSYKGKLFVIINSHVISAAATFAAVLKDKTNAILVGEETGGGFGAHNSSVITFELPNSRLKVNIPTHRYYQPVKDTLPGRGVLPHKYIPFSAEDFMAYKDNAMDYIIDSLIARH